MEGITDTITSLIACCSNLPSGKMDAQLKSYSKIWKAVGKDGKDKLSKLIKVEGDTLYRSLPDDEEEILDNIYDVIANGNFCFYSPHRSVKKRPEVNISKYMKEAIDNANKSDSDDQANRVPDEIAFGFVSSCVKAGCDSLSDLAGSLELEEGEMEENVPDLFDFVGPVQGIASSMVGKDGKIDVSQMRGMFSQATMGNEELTDKLMESVSSFQDNPSDRKGAKRKLQDITKQLLDHAIPDEDVPKIKDKRDDKK